VSNQVYANNMEVSCKQAAGKSICAFPDGCMTPPQTPATPPGVPIPYPNTGLASDTSDGSSSVKISGQEVMLKNKSCFKKSIGDEAGAAPMKGVITHKNTGKVFFNAWSMDVKVEGENVVRHFDLTTHNHASAPGGTPPWLHADKMMVPPTDPICSKLQNSLNSEHQNQLPAGKQRIYEDSPGEAKPSTLAVGVIIGGPSGLVAGHSGVSARTVTASRKIKRGGQYSHYAKGINRGQRSNVKECSGGQNTGKRFTYKDNPGSPNQGHAEAKIIEEWFRGGGQGTLVLTVSRPTCTQCARLIRAVNCSQGGGENCNKIKVCDSQQDDESRGKLKC
jgi:hypothetical protein